MAFDETFRLADPEPLKRMQDACEGSVGQRMWLYMLAVEECSRLTSDCPDAFSVLQA
jgi:hypothetical protein